MNISDNNLEEIETREALEVPNRTVRQQAVDKMLDEMRVPGDALHDSSGDEWLTTGTRDRV